MAKDHWIVMSLKASAYGNHKLEDMALEELFYNLTEAREYAKRMALKHPDCAVIITQDMAAFQASQVVLQI